MKVYLLLHSINEACKPFDFFEVVSVHSTREKALASLETIAESIASGNSVTFPDYVPKREPYAGIGKGYTYEWYSESGEKSFSHFYIVEKDMD